MRNRLPSAVTAFGSRTVPSAASPLVLAGGASVVEGCVFGALCCAAALLPISRPILDDVAQVMKDRPDLKIRVEGHTDDQGSDDANLKLSQDRAETVKAYLVKNHGVAANRLTAEGFGDTKPLAPNTDEEGRAKNRRVELSKL